MLALETEDFIPKPAVLLVDCRDSRVQLLADGEDARDRSAKLLHGEGIRVKSSESGKFAREIHMGSESHFATDESPDF